MGLDYSSAQKRKSEIIKQLTQLRKDAKNETDKRKKKKINREIKKLQDSLPNLKRIIYEKSKNQERDKNEERNKEKILERKVKAERDELIKKDLENRKNRRVFSPSEKGSTENSTIVCPSCGVPYNYSSGFSRCGCN